MGSSPISTQLAAAQAVLLARRQALGILPLPPAQRPLPPPPPTLTEALHNLPPHLGWGSEVASRAVRAVRRPSARPPFHPPVAGPPPAPLSRPAAPPTQIAVYPELALALLRRRAVAAGRVWLLLRALDTQAQGWLSLDAVRCALAEPGSPYHLCGRRQLRKLLAQGEALFWTRAAQRLWLRGQARVAADLGVTRLALDPVTLPLSKLCGSVRQARAQLYASFHSSRAVRRPAPDSRSGAPIARATLRRLTDRSRQTQAAYERSAGVVARRNVARGPAAPAANQDALGWRHGRALFILTDHGGRHGPAGKRYFAWQLPNSYAGARGQRVRGHGGRRRLNRRLTDLLLKGRTGNSQPAAPQPPWATRFCRDAAAACHTATRDAAAYWPASPGGTQLWFLPCQP